MGEAVYIAGKLNDRAVDYLKHVHQMMRLAENCRQAGFAVFVPCLDLLMGIMFGNYDYSDYAENNLKWLEKADAVLFRPEGLETSIGTQKELERAAQLQIPVFDCLKELERWAKNSEQKEKRQ